MTCGDTANTRLLEGFHEGYIVSLKYKRRNQETFEGQLFTSTGMLKLSIIHAFKNTADDKVFILVRLPHVELIEHILEELAKECHYTTSVEVQDDVYIWQLTL